MNTPIILGCDPGKTGALAGLDAATGALIWCEDCPPYTGAALGAALQDLLSNELVVAAHVEQVQSRPGQGHMNVWAFSGNYHGILAALGALGVPVEHATTNAWRKSNGIVVPKQATPAATRRRGKELCRQKAVELWPEMSAVFARVKDDGRAEAALIGRHGWLARVGERAA